MKSLLKIVNTPGADILILVNQVNTIVADALAPCVSRSSAAMVFAMLGKQALDSHEEGFLL